MVKFCENHTVIWYPWHWSWHNSSHSDFPSSVCPVWCSLFSSFKSIKGPRSRKIWELWFRLSTCSCFLIFIDDVFIQLILLLYELTNSSFTSSSSPCSEGPSPISHCWQPQMSNIRPLSSGCGIRTRKESHLSGHLDQNVSSETVVGPWFCLLNWENK